MPTPAHRGVTSGVRRMGDPTLYGAAHRAERQAWERRLEQDGPVACASPWCKTPHIPITHGDPWDLGHTHGRQGHRGPEHPPCNRATTTHQASLRRRPPEPHPGQIGAAP